MELKRVRLTHRRVSRGRGCGRERGQAEGGGAGPGGGREAFWEGGVFKLISETHTVLAGCLSHWQLLQLLLLALYPHIYLDLSESPGLGLLSW